MINDQCDVLKCDNRAIAEIEEDDQYYFVCKNHAKNKLIVRTEPNEHETHIYGVEE